MASAGVFRSHHVNCSAALCCTGNAFSASASHQPPPPRGAGFLILGVATFLSVASLGDGQWVVAVFSSQNGDGQTSVNFGCGPLGAGAFVKTPDSTSNTHYEVTEIEERWPILRPFLNPDNREAVTGKSTEELLTNTFKMMISAVRSCATEPCGCCLVGRLRHAARP